MAMMEMLFWILSSLSNLTAKNRGDEVHGLVLNGIPRQRVNLGQSRLVSLAIVDKSTLPLVQRPPAASDPIHDFGLSTVRVLLTKTGSAAKVKLVR